MELKDSPVARSRGGDGLSGTRGAACERQIAVPRRQPRLWVFDRAWLEISFAHTAELLLFRMEPA